MHTPIALPEVTIVSAAVSEMRNNVYVLTGTRTGRQLLVDAADDAPAIRRLLAEAAHGNPLLDTIVTTHAHWDHVRALPELAREAVRTAAGSADADAIVRESGVATLLPLEHGDRLDLGDFALDVVSLRGHTPGSVALVLTSENGTVVAFTGDSLFPGGPGKTTTPEDFTSLMNDLEQRVFGVYPDETIVLPGHGASTTLGAERGQLGEWRARGW